jgi:hypothetical protein
MKTQLPSSAANKDFSADGVTQAHALRDNGAHRSDHQADHALGVEILCALSKVCTLRPMP